MARGRVPFLSIFACGSMRRRVRLNAFSFAIMTVFSSGISMYAMALLIETLGLFHGIIPDQYVFHVPVALSAFIVLGYIFLGGLTSAIDREVLQSSF